MRAFAKPTSLSRLSLEARLIYTAFAVFMLIGYATSAWLYLDADLGVTRQSAARYYLGDDTLAPVDGAGLEASEGKDIELPDSLPTSGLRLQKPARQVVETFHFHLFTVSVCFLVIAHLFMMSGFGTRFKSILIAVSALGTLIHLVAPVAIRFLSTGFSALMFPSAVVMGATWLFMTLEPIWEMWRGPMVGFAAPSARNAQSSSDVPRD